MRLVDFLILILQTHAQVLSDLSEVFGEDILMEMLEDTGEKFDEVLTPSRFAQKTHADSVIWLDSPHPHSNADAYGELEDAVQDLKMPKVLEFYLWAYPHYRAFIESALDLNSRVKSVGDGPTAEALIDEAVQNGHDWIRTFDIKTPHIRELAYKISAAPWLKFRAEALKKLGKKPFTLV